MTDATQTPPTTPAADPRPITQRLKEDNWDLHQVAENAVLPRHMIGGTLPRVTYAEMLGQLLLANRALDRRIREHRDAVPALRELVTDDQLQEPYILEDLAYLGVSPDGFEPAPATRALIDEIDEAARTEPLRLFGLHYVREGANNGNRYVAKKLRKAWGIDGDEGMRYLDPYGDRQRPLWDAFKEKLAAMPFTEDEKQTVVAGARSMFRHLMAINDAIIEHTKADLPEPPSRPAHAH